MSPTRLGCVAHRKTYKGKLFTRIKSLFFFSLPDASKEPSGEKHNARTAARCCEVWTSCNAGVSVNPSDVASSKSMPFGFFLADSGPFPPPSPCTPPAPPPPPSAAAPAPAVAFEPPTTFFNSAKRARFGWVGKGRGQAKEKVVWEREWRLGQERWREGWMEKKRIARGLNLNVDSCHLVSSHAFRYRPHLAAVRLLACRGPRVSPAALTALQPDRLNILQQLWLRVPSCCPLAVGCVSIGGKGCGDVNVEWIPGERKMRGSGVWCACVSMVD